MKAMAQQEIVVDFKKENCDQDNEDKMVMHPHFTTFIWFITFLLTLKLYIDIRVLTSNFVV